MSETPVYEIFDLVSHLLTGFTDMSAWMGKDEEETEVEELDLPDDQ